MLVLPPLLSLHPSVIGADKTKQGIYTIFSKGELDQRQPADDDEKTLPAVHRLILIKCCSAH